MQRLVSTQNATPNNSFYLTRLLTESHDIVPFPSRLRLHKGDPISHLTSPRYRPLFHWASALFSKARSSSFLAEDFSSIFADLLHALADTRTLRFRFPVTSQTTDDVHSSLGVVSHSTCPPLSLSPLANRLRHHHL
jgi:hypothetical protein